jgi:hypothetical protein
MLDWDDTLLPTTWLQTQSSMEPSTMAETVQEVTAVVRAAKALGTVVIITNAMHGWVETCCRSFAPDLEYELEDVRIIYARPDADADGRIQMPPSTWKRHAFEEEVNRFRLNSRQRCLNLVSVGDSLYERDALLRANFRDGSCFRKSVKLMEYPSATRLVQQLRFVSEHMHELALHPGDLDLGVGCHICE